MLRLQSFIALLEKNQYVRKSAIGLREDYPELFERIRGFYEEKELYGLLELLMNQPVRLDDEYMIWIKTEELPHIFDKKESYSATECRIFSKQTAIAPEEFKDIIEATTPFVVMIEELRD